MSQIFENCRSKGACDYKFDEEYYEDIIYNNFAKDVQVNTEIYEPVVQNVEDHATKNIHKFQSKVKKDNASLIFDETSLKEAKVLGQVDCKFIAAIMKKRSGAKEAGEYLILFDQHAVSERIRLERNLADYLNEEQWVSVEVENIILKMSNDQILYLHNYKDKFTQLGLQWTINDKEVNVHSIPEAILGKNPREVEKVIKAVRNLIIEEINIMKLQKGCLSFYPKSIMDLVFSEACRYAIKFGDQLSKNDCIELLNALSNCKTPFQCAHGRPVMAVIMDIKVENRDYKINMTKLKKFKRVQ
uniref:MutL C-terminal dimerisation domain-containing protein n=1 Tax=Heliothis virescens TaxID=7102 RepID=A0A2A4JKW3_HELVI